MEESQKSGEPHSSFLTEAHSEHPIQPGCEAPWAAHSSGELRHVGKNILWDKTTSCLGPCTAFNATVQISLKCSETLLNVPKSPVRMSQIPANKTSLSDINKNPVLHIVLWQNFHQLPLSSRTQTIMTNNKCRSSTARSSHSYLTECS